tara:strand:- start:36 stop:731 length:696 start_codon:yes stop_codon:yes gene_type:complete
MDEDRDRTLRIEIPGCIFSKANTLDPEWDVTLTGNGANGWESVSLGGAPSLTLGWRGSIDLSGYARDYKTFYPEGGLIQEGPYYYAIDGFGQLVSTVVSSVPIDLEQFAYTIATLSTPGMIVINNPPLIQVNQNWETTLFCETQTNLINTNLPASGFCLPVSKNQTGSLSPTAAQVLYVAKIVIPVAIAGESGVSVGVPASRVILPGKMDQEPELEYMMRLSRSVELANQV